MNGENVNGTPDGEMLGLSSFKSIGILKST
jgi:hypothetical protein